MKLPWTDRAGRFAPLKAAVFAALLVPGLWLVLALWTTGIAQRPLLSARPITDAIHETGDWAIRFLWISLAVTPLRRIAQWPKLIQVRRMIGVGAFCYALAHFLLYMLDLKFALGRIASEIALRFYLTIGFVALLGLSALAATSTDAAIKRLGPKWNLLHKAVYAIGVLAALHFFMQTKADVFEATIMAGLFALLMLYRVAHWRGLSLTSPVILAGIAVLAALLTVGFEYAWYAIATGVPPGRVLAANLAFSYSIRPAWWVLLVGLGVVALAAARLLFGGNAAPRGRARQVRAAG